MKLKTALIVAAFVAAGPALAQSSTPPATAAKPAQHQPGTAASSSQSQAAAPAAAPAEKLDPAKEAAIRHLLDLTEISKMGENINSGISREVQGAVGRGLQQDQVPKFMDTFNTRFAAAAPPSKVTDSIVPIYAKHFTLEEIQGLIKFYESPLGQKLVKEMPEVVQESQSAGVQMDQNAALAVLRSMQDDYPVLKQMLPPDPNAPPAAAPAPAGPSDSGAPAPPPLKSQPGTPATPKQ
jgi:uncharacterized protein